MKTRVVLITPPLDSSGGIGRLMSYVLTSVSREDVEIRLLDTRGRSSHAALSIFPLVRSWVRLVLLALARGVDVAHINISSGGSSVRKPVILWTCWVLRIPVVLHLHASEYPEFFDSLPKSGKAVIRRTFATADRVLVLGSRWHDYVCAELGVPPDRVEVLLNAAPGPEVAPQSYARPTGMLRILFLGRLGERKGVPEILRALSDDRLREKGYVAVLAGDGEVARFRAEAQNLGIGDDVSFPGWVDTTEARRLLAESDVLLLPSHAEGLPMSVIEAFAHGVPVIGTAVGSMPDILENGVNGSIVRVGDSSQLVEALARMIDDEPLRARLAENARRTWEERLDIASYAFALERCWSAVSAAPLGRQANV
jgi:glycosyltransferase involved in cell wall biosynthesis